MPVLAGPAGLDALLLLLGAAAGIATLAGGALALRLERRLPLILGFSAGAVIGVALLDLAPEALHLAPGRPDAAMLAVAIGFMTYLAADRALAALGGKGGHLAAAGLTLHSLMDGLAIGLAFQVSAGAAAVVAVAVLAHDVADGINTITVSLGGSTGRAWARRWLVADAVAPLAGVVLSFAVHAPRTDFAYVLALFAGAFLYVGASELVPASHRRHPHAWTTVSTLAGCALIWLVVHLANVGVSH